jgi:uncharacterized protein (DUF433 family)
MSVKNQHAYIEHVEGRNGGSAVVKRTRIPVWVIAEYYRAGLTPEEILAHHPQLTLSRVFDALGYFDDHRDEIESDIAANSPPDEAANT